MRWHRLLPIVLALGVIVGGFIELLPVMRHARWFERSTPVSIRGARSFVAEHAPAEGPIFVHRNDLTSMPSSAVRHLVLALGWDHGFDRVVETRESPPAGSFSVRYPFASPRSAAPLPSKVSPWRELAGVGAVALVVILLLVCYSRFVPGESLGWRWGIVAMAFVVGAMFAMSHSFIGPNGTGVCGGRARLWLEGCALAWNSPQLEYLQMAYPPLQALITAFAFLVSGACGDWVTQLIVPLFAAVTAWLLLRGGGGISVALMFSWTYVMAMSSYGMEPLMMLLLVAGWGCVEMHLPLHTASKDSAIRRGRDSAPYQKNCNLTLPSTIYHLPSERNEWGWALIALAGLVKNEGVVYLFALIALHMMLGRGRVSWRWVAIGLAPVVAWHVGCRIGGASLHDYASPWCVDPVRACAAVKAVAYELICRPWRYGFVAYALPLAALLPPLRRRALALCGFVEVIVLFVVYAFSLSRAPDFNWHLMSIPRLLLPMAMIVVWELGTWWGNADRVASAFQYVTITPMFLIQ